MRINSPTTIAFIFGFGVAVALASICAVFVRPHGIDGYNLWSQEAAGWAQAIGTIVAIFGAYAISNRQHQLSQKSQEHESRKKAVALAHFFAPALRTIEADVDSLIEFCARYKNIGARNIAKTELDDLNFRATSDIGLILNNIHTFPGELGKTIPQLLGFREVVDENLKRIADRARKTGAIDSSQFRNLLIWLELMKGIIVEIYRDMPNIHD